MAFLDPIALSKLDGLAVKSRVIVEGALTGMHRAKLRGSSVEFAEHKEYSQGDEIRHLDWKVLAKSDRYVVKQFEQESEMTSYLVLDASGSMNYQGRGLSKREYACHLLGALAYLLIHQRDRVGLTIFGNDTLDRFVPPRGKPAQLRTVLGMLEEVARTKQSGKQNLADALERIAEQSRRRRGLVLICSDLFDNAGPPLAELKHLRARGHDVALFQTLDRDELEFPFDGLTIFKSLEGTDKRLVDPASIRKLYRDRMQSFVEECQRECQRSGIEYQLVPTDQSFEATLLSFLNSRLAGSPQRARR